MKYHKVKTFFQWRTKHQRRSKFVGRNFFSSLFFSFSFVSVSSDDFLFVQEKILKVINIGLNLHIKGFTPLDTDLRGVPRRWCLAPSATSFRLAPSATSFRLAPSATRFRQCRWIPTTYAGE